MSVLVDRRRILQRIRRSAVPLIALVAPAGYGKSYIAQRIAREDPHWGTVDAGAIADASAFAQALAQWSVLAPGAEGLVGVVKAWSRCAEPISLIVDNLEAATPPDVLETIAELISARPPLGKIILCARRAVPFELSDLAPPHLIATVRAEDLRFDHNEMAQLFSETDADATALFVASRFTEGWPVVALYLQRLMQEGALDPQSDDLPDALLTELFDYIDAQVLGKLPAPALHALTAAAGWSDLTEAEIEAACDETGAIADLVRNHQLARRGAQDRVELHPLIRRTIAHRHGRQLSAALRLLAERFVANESVARAAECYLLANDLAAAADCAMHLKNGFLTLVGMRPMGVAYGDNAGGLAMNPEIRLAVAAVRRLVEPSKTLPREVLSVRESTRGESPALDKSAIGIAVLTLIDAGRTAEAVGLMEEAAPQANEPGSGPDLVMLNARLGLFAHLGRFAEGMQLWQPLRRHVHGNAVWLAQLIRFEVQAARTLARWEVEHEALERMVSMARSGRKVPMIGLALAEAVFGTWLAGENTLFERYCVELERLVERYDIPLLLRFTLAATGRPPRIDVATSPLWDARAFLIASARAQDGTVAANYAQAALDAADVADDSVMKVLARVGAAEKFGSARARLREALVLCDSIESDPLRDSVSALAERGEVRGMLAPLVNRLRHRAAVVIGAADVPLSISIADGTIRRGEEQVDVSDGVLALLLALAVEPQAVTRDRLVDRLWPDLQDESAYNALKMCVHRTRQQLTAPGAILVSRGGYALAPDIDVDLLWLQRVLERVRRDTVLDSDVPRLEETFVRLVRGRPAAFANWEWFEQVEQTLAAATHEVGAFIAARALREHDHVRALGIAQALTKLDPLDESARHIAISAHIAADDRSAAILDYRGYKTLLRAELDVEPSAGLKQLIEVG